MPETRDGGPRAAFVFRAPGPSEADVQAVALQLGRPARGAWHVARRCGCGLPQVIETFPRLVDGTPFPTLWWLTCRSLRAAVGRMEAGGWMARINERLTVDSEFRSRLESAVGRYLAARDALDVLPALHPGGGPARIKCLHAHTAQHLAGSDNLVGTAVLEELSWVDPADACVCVSDASRRRASSGGCP